MALPSEADLRDATCVACPGQALPLGRFDVAERPGPQIPFDHALGYRVHAATGVPTCVHPYRVGVPAAPYASRGQALPTGPATVPPPPADPDLPADPSLLEAWIIAVVRSAPPAALGAALRRAETTARERFAPADVVAALRRVLTVELTRPG